MDTIKLFNSAVTISFMGSVLVLIILLMKSIFRKRLNSYFHYYIWILLLIRLVMPYSIQSNFSIHNALNSAFRVGNETRSINNIIPTDSLLYNYTEDMNISSKPPENNVEKETTGAMIKDNKYSPGNVMGIIWLSGSSIMILLVVYSHYRIRYLIKNSIDYSNHVFNNILANCINTVNVSSKVRLIYTNKIASPSLYGIINPAIIIPLKVAKNIEADEFRYIVLHELLHLKRKDVFLNWTTTLLQCIYWFNPIILYGLYRMKQDCEIACDQHVISYLKDSENLSYGNTLIRMLETTNDRQWLPGAASLSKNKVEMKRRITMITNYKKLSVGGVVFGVVFLAFIGLIGLTNSIAKADVSDNNNVKSVKDINEKSTKIVCITLSDNMEEFDKNRPISNYPNLPPYIVTSEDIKSMSNQLKKLGADKIYVNGEQISEKSEINSYGQFVEINGSKYISPFIIKGEWNENISLDNLVNNNSVINDLKSRRKIIVDINNRNPDIYKVIRDAFLTDKGYTGEVTDHMTRALFEKINIYNTYPVNGIEYKLPLKVYFILQEVSQDRVNEMVYVRMVYSFKIVDSQNKTISEVTHKSVTFTVENANANWYVTGKEEQA